MERRWISPDGTQSPQRFFANFVQLPPAVPGPPYMVNRLTSEPVVSIRPDLIFSESRAMPSRGKIGKVSRPAAGPRRGSQQSPFSGAAQEQLEQFAQQANSSVTGDGTHVTHSSPSDGGNHLDNSIHLTGTDVLGNGAGSIAGLHSSIQQAFTEGDGFNLDHQQQHLAQHHSSPSTGTPVDVHASPPRMDNGAPMQTAADVAIAAYGDQVKIDSALCKKLAGEAALREPTQRRHDQKLNIERRSNVEALLAHVTGEVAPRPCKNCHKGHGPWTHCVVYDGQMCGSCTNCWFNASGSRCTFHENNNPQPSHIYTPTVPTVPSQTQTPQAAQAQPAMSYQQPHASMAAAATAVNHTNSVMSPVQADINQWGLSDPTRRLVSQAMGDVATLTKRQRFIARIEAAAKELGMRIAEYDDYLRTPEGMVEQARSQHQELAHHNQSADVSMDAPSPEDDMQ